MFKFQRCSNYCCCTQNFDFSWLFWNVSLYLDVKKKCFSFRKPQFPEHTVSHSDNTFLSSICLKLSQFLLHLCLSLLPPTPHSPHAWGVSDSWSQSWDLFWSTTSSQSITADMTCFHVLSFLFPKEIQLSSCHRYLFRQETSSLFKTFDFIYITGNNYTKKTRSV